MSTSSRPASFAQLLQQFFVERLMQQRHASPCTVASYRDTFRVMLAFAHQHLKTPPTQFTLEDLDARFVLAFLNYLETDRLNSIRSRNARLAAIRSFLRYAGSRQPDTLAVAESVLAIPMKRYERPLMGFLSRPEMQALLLAPDPGTWAGRRDRALLATLYNTGARASELITLRVEDLVLQHTPAVRIHGKGRKERTVPLWRTTATQLRHWLHECSSTSTQPLFPARSGKPLSRSALTERFKLAVRAATTRCPQIAKRRISPHTIRHTTAMHLLQSGVDITVIALWLGHESPATTHLYIEADMTMKTRALSTLQPPRCRHSRYQPADRVLQFLQSL